MTIEPLAMLGGMFAALLAAGLVALVAWGLRTLDTGGAVIATLVGTAAIGAGWRWVVVLLAYFASTAALGLYRREAKRARTAGIVEKEGPRDAVQVVANGGVFAFAAAAAWTGHLSPTAAAALGLGALAASAADSWATEVGTADGGPPRSILTGRPIDDGMSGGITAAGTFASIAGAAMIGSLTLFLGWPAPVALAVTAGGVAGSVADSLLGATLQARRWCPRCARATEQHIHVCGTPTAAHGGLGWLENDAVNLVTTLVGGLLALWIAG